MMHERKEIAREREHSEIVVSKEDDQSKHTELVDSIQRAITDLYHASATTTIPTAMSAFGAENEESNSSSSTEPIIIRKNPNNLHESSLSRKRPRSRNKSTTTESIAITTSSTNITSSSSGDDMIEKKDAGPKLSWGKHYAALCQYGNEHGHCNIPQKDSYECDLMDYPATTNDNEANDDNGNNEKTVSASCFHYKAKLGYWLHTQRASKKGATSCISTESHDNDRKKKSSDIEKSTRKSTLSSERKALLQKLVDEGKLLWDASSQMGGAKVAQQGDVDWPRHYGALLKYCQQYGHCNVPTRMVYECDLTDVILPSLTSTDSTTDSQISNNSSSAGSTSSSRIQGSSTSSSDSSNANSYELNSIVTANTMDIILDSNLVSSITTDGGSNNSNNNNNANQYRGNLGTWLSTQRRAQKEGQKQGQVSGSVREVKLKLLQQLVDEGKLQWDCSSERLNEKKKRQGDYDWPRHYAALVAYRTEHGHCNVPKRDSYQCLLPVVSNVAGAAAVAATTSVTSNIYINNLTADIDVDATQNIFVSHSNNTNTNNNNIDIATMIIDESCGGIIVNNFTISARASDDGHNQRAHSDNNSSSYINNSNNYCITNTNSLELRPKLSSSSSSQQQQPVVDESMTEVYQGKLGGWLHTQRCAKRDQQQVAAMTMNTNTNTATGKEEDDDNNNTKKKCRYTFLTPEREALLQSLVDKGMLLWDASAHRPAGLRYCTRRSKTSTSRTANASVSRASSGNCVSVADGDGSEMSGGNVHNNSSNNNNNNRKRKNKASAALVAMKQSSMPPQSLTKVHANDQLSSFIITQQPSAASSS